MYHMLYSLQGIVWISIFAEIDEGEVLIGRDRRISLFFPGGCKPSIFAALVYARP